MDEQRAPLLGVAVGTGLALIGLLLASAKGAPYLTTDSVNGWIVLFAFGLLGALFATPFAIERRMRSRYEESDRRWERSLLAWGAIAIGVTARRLPARRLRRLGLRYLPGGGGRAADHHRGGHRHRDDGRLAAIRLRR